MSNSRLYKAHNQKLYYIDKISHNVFAIMGTTGNVYDVTIDKTPSCTCPDHVSRKSRCKHILFVLARILSVDDPMKKNFSCDDLKNIFNKKIENNELCVNNDQKKKYINFLKNNDNDDICDDYNDVCGICLDEITKNEKTLMCKLMCKKLVHKECYDMWMLKTNNNICVYCKSQFNYETKSTYINIK